MKVHYLGHSSILIENGKTKVLIDPFLSGNPLQTKDFSDLEVDYIALTHAHADHIGDAVAIAKNNHCPIIASPELSQLLADEYDHFIPVGLGGTIKAGDLSLKYTLAYHGAGFTGKDGKVYYGGAPAGIVIHDEKNSIYHAGDTTLFGDMRKIGEEFALDFALLPIGGTFTMDMNDALRAANLLRPKQIIPIHYNTFPAIKIDIQEWKDKVQAAGFETLVLDYNEAVEL